jgi:uncharacterized membrane protein
LNVKEVFVFLPILVTMKQDEIRQLQIELEQLSRDVQLQQQKIIQLQKRLAQLTHTEIAPSQPVNIHTATAQKFSLENFIGLRLINFIGIIVLVIGLSIGVKYAIDRNLISELMRISLAYLAGIVLYLLSLQLRKKYLLFSAILFSGGMASLYFTTYAAYVYYNMFSFGVAFAMMVALTVYAVYEATKYNRQEIALLGLVGAYGIPFLVSKNAERADLFFLYISLINLGVIYLSVKKVWKVVGIVAQILTWVLFIGWAAMRYDQRFKLVAASFMTLFFLAFLFAVLSYKLLRKKSFQINDAYQLILNNVALYVATLFQFGFSDKGTSGDLALVTLIVCGVVSLQAILSFNYWKEEVYTIRLLSSLALTLFVMFVAFNWDGFTVTFLWLFTAVVVFAWGFRMRSVRARMAGIILIGVTLAKLLALDSLTFTTVQKVIAYLVLGILLLVVSFFYQKFRQQLFSDKDGSSKSL